MYFTHPKQYVDLSNKMDLDFWHCFGRKETLSYSQRNMVSNRPLKGCFINLLASGVDPVPKSWWSNVIDLSLRYFSVVKSESLEIFSLQVKHISI